MSPALISATAKLLPQVSPLPPTLVNVVLAHEAAPDTEAIVLELPMSEALLVNCTVLVPLWLRYLKRTMMPVTVALVGRLNEENVNTAISGLRTFINKVNAFINARKLLPEEGQPLIDSANDVIDELSG